MYLVLVEKSLFGVDEEKLTMKNSNNKRILVILIALAIVLAAALIMVMFLQDDQQQAQPTDPLGSTTPALTTETTTASTQESAQATEPTVATTEETTVPATPAPDDVKIETPYGTLYYSGEWGEFLEVQTEGDTYTFYANVTEQKQQKLFSLTFGGDVDGALGILRDEAGNAVPLHVRSYKFTPDDSWSDRECNIVYTMMDLLNDLLNLMPLEPVPEPTQPPTTVPNEGDREGMGIDTAYCQLMYPAQWADHLKLDIKQDSASFYCVNAAGQDMRLFTIYFGGDQGIVLKSIQDYSGNDVEVRLDIEELNPDSDWSDEDMRTAQAMQEDLNYLLEKLP